MTALVLAALLWVAVHVGIAGTAIRAGLAARLGEGGFRAAFSLLSVVSIALLVMAWQAAPLVILWDAPPWLGWLIVALMLPAFWLFVASVATPNPTAVGGRLAESGAAASSASPATRCCGASRSGPRCTSWRRATSPA
jgi:uncharacterized membrane protein